MPRAFVFQRLQFWRAFRRMPSAIPGRLNCSSGEKVARISSGMKLRIERWRGVSPDLLRAGDRVTESLSSPCTCTGSGAETGAEVAGSSGSAAGPRGVLPCMANLPGVTVILRSWGDATWCWRLLLGALGEWSCVPGCEGWHWAGMVQDLLFLHWLELDQRAPGSRTSGRPLARRPAEQRPQGTNKT